MNTILKLAGITLIDYGLLWALVNEINPDPTISIVIIHITTVIFLLNLAIAGALYKLKKLTYARLFVANSFIASFLFIYLFVKAIN